MKIIVCGDSFASADKNNPGTHFSELLCNHGNDVINLARGGISNVGIAFQLQTAIELLPDVVIFTTTTHDRLDVVVNNRKFKSLQGLKNFIYPYQSDLSTGSKYVGGADAAIMSDVVQAFLQPRPDCPVELKEFLQSDIIKNYLVHFHNSEFKQVQNDWMIGYWKYVMKERNIPFIHIYRNGPVGQKMYQYVTQYSDLVNQSVYHTDAYTQVLVAEELQYKLKELFK